MEDVLERAVNLQHSQAKMVKELGFDASRETFIKGNESVVIMLELIKDFYLVVFLEMSPLKVEFFDCEQFVATIDDLVVSLIEVIEGAENA